MKDAFLHLQVIRCHRPLSRSSFKVRRADLYWGRLNIRLMFGLSQEPTNCPAIMWFRISTVLTTLIHSCLLWSFSSLIIIFGKTNDWYVISPVNLSVTPTKIFPKIWFSVLIINNLKLLQNCHSHIGCDPMKIIWKISGAMQSFTSLYKLKNFYVSSSLKKK